MFVFLLAAVVPSKKKLENIRAVYVKLTVSFCFLSDSKALLNKSCTVAMKPIASHFL